MRQQRLRCRPSCWLLSTLWILALGMLTCVAYTAQVYSTRVGGAVIRLGGGSGSASAATVDSIFTAVRPTPGPPPPRPPPSLPPQPPSPPPPSDPPPWVIADEPEDEPPVWLRVGSRFLHSSSRGYVRPAALHNTTRSAHFRRVAAHHPDGRSGYLLRAEYRATAIEAHKYVAVIGANANSDWGGELERADRSETARLLVFALPEVGAAAAPVRTLSVDHGNACLRYPPMQKPPALKLELEHPCSIRAAHHSDAHPATEDNETTSSSSPSADFLFKVGFAPPTPTPTPCASPPSHAADGASPPEPSAALANSSAAVTAASQILTGETAAVTDLALTGAAPEVVRIALGVAVRTHEPTAPDELPLLKVFIPSLVATIGGESDSGCPLEVYHYTLYLGYDADDPTYDEPVSLAGIAAFLRRALKGLPVQVVGVRYGGEDKGAPCWVWNKLFHRACHEADAPAEYFYQLVSAGCPAPRPSSSARPRTWRSSSPVASSRFRVRPCLRLCASLSLSLSLSLSPLSLSLSVCVCVCVHLLRVICNLLAPSAPLWGRQNDDLKLTTPDWAPRFVHALRASYPPNFGITGPLDLNNERLMTQSFVHCSHLQALGFYYPWRFKNWYSDDWCVRTRVR
jgi:hypothetical protein